MLICHRSLLVKLDFSFEEYFSMFQNVFALISKHICQSKHWKTCILCKGTKMREGMQKHIAFHKSNFSLEFNYFCIYLRMYLLDCLNIFPNKLHFVHSNNKSEKRYAALCFTNPISVLSFTISPFSFQHCLNSIGICIIWTCVWKFIWEIWSS